MDDLERRLERAIQDQTHEIDPGLIQEVMALPPDYPGLDRIIDMLTSAGTDQPASPPLNPEDFYRPGTEPYRLRWPLSPALRGLLPVPFEALDHKTQFYVLFQEWTRVELEAVTRLNGGDPERARALFQECLARAEQLNVPELKARSHGNLASSHKMVGDLQAAQAEYQWAKAERGRG